jgi:hypothetical protein
MELSWSRAYIFGILLIHTVYVLLFIGIITAVPTFIETLNTGLQTVLCLVLMYRFNPFRTHYKLHDTDARFIFGSAMLLFTNVVLIKLASTDYIGKYVIKAQEWVQGLMSGVKNT